MIKSIGDYPKRQSLNSFNCFLTCVRIDYYTRQIRYFCNPPTIQFCFYFQGRILLIKNLLYRLPQCKDGKKTSTMSRANVFFLCGIRPRNTNASDCRTEFFRLFNCEAFNLCPSSHS